jgi:exodeoxyribonuclease VII small subunit
LTDAAATCTVAAFTVSTAMAATEKTDKPNDLGGLEKSLEELEALVTRLESGDLPLEQALKEFEHGVKLTRQCQTALQEAEQKVEILLKKTAAAEPSPFTDDED